MKDSLLLYEKDNQTAVLTLNRPEVMNSFNFALLDACRERIDALYHDSSVRVVIITGAGEKAFSAGADLKEKATLTTDQVKRYILTIRNLFTSIERLPKPVIAAINGIALGGGTELALCSDIRLAATNASMGLTEVRWAIVPGAGGTQRLPRLVGKGIAKELIFSGRRVDSQEAYAMGLVNRICEKENLLDDCLKMAETICENGPIAVEQAKLAINYGIETDLTTGLELESNAYWATLRTKDRQEGLLAFKEKRKPIYRGE